jgi:hypothetical protein
MPILPVASPTRRPANHNCGTSLQRFLRGRRCRCAGCLLEFNSISAFDRHCAGDGLDRHCLTTNEMIALRMPLNGGGWWVSRTAIPPGQPCAGAAIAVGAPLPPGVRVSRPVRKRRRLAEEVSQCP